MAKTVIVTGGSRGIGAAAAALFAERGYQTVINYRKSREEAERLCRVLCEKGYTATAIYGDISETEDVRRLFARTDALYGGVDVLVNNAGIAGEHLLTDVTDGEYERLFAVNMGGVFRCCREAIPYMLRNHAGSIVNVSSMWGQTGASCEAVYSAAKGAVIAFTKALAKELGCSGIRVNCVCPGVIDTDMNAMYGEDVMRELAEETPLSRIGKPQEVAESICYLASDRASFITGQILGVNGGFVI